MSQLAKLFSRHTFLILMILIIGLAAGLRLWRLAEFPAGLHQDEAWFAYNAFLLLQNGANIYGDRWPLTVDMWGDHVSAVHSYMIVPFIALFGVHTFAFRLTFVTFSLACLVLAAYIMWRLTRNRMVVMGSSLLFALSAWNIVMTRASSTVIIDTFMVLSVIAVFVVTLQWAARQSRWGRAEAFRLGMGLLATYALTVAAYFTYFTSRLILPPLLLSTIVFVFWGQKVKRWVWGVAALVTLVYLLFPFGVMLKTPYALGRYQETAIINSNTVKGHLTSDISRSGQAGIPPLVTRAFYNKVTENAQALIKQYVGLFSPQVLLYQTAPPIRYFVPHAGSISYLEYVGFLALVGIVLIGGPKHRYFRAGVLVLFWLLMAAVPSALTEDDYPNMQRAVIMTPFWQMAAALGLWSVVSEGWRLFKKQSEATQLAGFAGLLIVAALPSLISFMTGYFIQAKYFRPHFRSRAGEELAMWINEHAHDAPLIQEHIEGVFYYPYLFNQEDLRQLPIEKPGKYFYTADRFQIGNRTFVKDLCASSEARDPKYQYVIFFTLHERCKFADGMVKVFSAKYDDGSEGFGVYRHKTPAELEEGVAQSL